MNFRKILIIISIVGIVLVLFSVSRISYQMGVNYGSENADIILKSKIIDSLKNEKIIPIVNVKKIINSKQNSEIKSSGRVLSYNSITVSSEVNGKLETGFSIKKGTNFNKGDVLFKINNKEFKLLIESRKSSFMNLVSSILADIKLDFPNEFIKWEKYFQSISLDKKLDKLPKTNSNREKNFIVSRRIVSEYLTIKSDEEKLKKYTIRAPFDGSILKSYTDISANVNIGSPIIDIIREGKNEVELNINASERNLINIGDKVILKSENEESEYNGKITRIANFVNPQTQNISVFVEIKKTNYPLFDGMYLSAKIHTKNKIKSCKIPSRSLVSKNDVYIIDTDNKLKKKEINIISKLGNSILVDNLEDNELIVIEPLINAKEGLLVSPVIK
tara:strand:+ start:3750 stop:4916 length:1167 start_codon:yes stop_codon:yes gene_type:complete